MTKIFCIELWQNVANAFYWVKRPTKNDFLKDDQKMTKSRLISDGYYVWTVFGHPLSGVYWPLSQYFIEQCRWSYDCMTTDEHKSAPTKLHVRPAKTEISLCIRFIEHSVSKKKPTIQSVFKPTVKTLISQYGCTGLAGRTCNLEGTG